MKLSEASEKYSKRVGILIEKKKKKKNKIKKFF